MANDYQQTSVSGTSYQDFDVLLYSLYWHLAEARDAAALVVQEEV